MSRLIDKLDQMTRTAPPPMGFRSTANALCKQKPLVIAGIDAAEKADQATEVSRGADAVLFQPGTNMKKLSQMASSLTDIPWGVYVQSNDKKELKAALDSKLDFAVMTPETSALVLPKETGKVGKILQLPSSLESSLLHSVNDLAVDAVLLQLPESSPLLTWRSIMEIRRVVSLLGKYLLLSAAPGLEQEELQTLWEAGVDGMVVQVNTEQPVPAFIELCQLVGKTTFQPRRKKKVEAILPTIKEETPAPPEEEEEEDE